MIKAFPAPTSSDMLILFPGLPSAQTVISGIEAPTRTKARGVVLKLRATMLVVFGTARVKEWRENILIDSIKCYVVFVNQLIVVMV